MKKTTRKIKIRKGLKIGELDAEADKELLEKCFVDTGDIQRLMAERDPAAVILGRTGAGKSALLYKISRTADNVSIIDPNNVSVQFLEHSNIIAFLSELSVNLDLFYRLLWKHILVVEILKQLYGERGLKDTQSIWDKIFGASRRKDLLREKAIKYFEDWGDKFWLETDEQLRELTERFQSEVEAAFKTKIPNVQISAAGAKSLDNEIRREIREKTNQVVSGLQVQRLNELVRKLEEAAFADRQKRYYILIDGLDENWAGTETRCRFIRALIEEIKALRTLEQVKIIIALRSDLLLQVFDVTRSSGFQQEKYEAYLLPIKWDTAQLRKLIDLRVNEVFKDQYTGQELSLEDVFPSAKKGGGQTAEGYILERTLHRPRDVLQFINEAFLAATGRDRISWRALTASESVYSVKRLNSLFEEWEEIHPSLRIICEILRGLPSSFSRSSITRERIESACLELFDGSLSDESANIAEKLYAAKRGASESDVLNVWLCVLYQVGIIGIKISSTESFRWSFIDQPSITISEAKRATRIKVHKMLFSALEIQTNLNVGVGRSS